LWYKNKSYEWTSDKQIKFTITYNGNECDEGSEIPVEQTKYLDEDIYLAYKGSLIKVGYDFDGWNTRSDGTGLNFNENDLFTINADTVLYAKWRPSFWIIQYNGNGNDQGIPPDSVEQPKGGNTIISSHGNLSRNYHSFIGWNTESDGSGTSYTPGQEVQFDSDITLYAMWSLITYTIQYSDQSAESGSAPDPQVKYHNTPITLHGNSGQLYRQNYDLVGWSTNSGGVGGYMFGLGAEYHLNMSATLYNPPAAPKITLRVVLIDESTPYQRESRCITDSNLWRDTYESTRLNETNKIRIYHLSTNSKGTKWDSIWHASAVNSLAGHIVQVVRPLVSERETFFTSTIYDEISNSFGWDNINKIIFLLDTSGSSSSLTKSVECTNFISSLNSDGRSVLSYNLTDEKWLQWLWTY